MARRPLLLFTTLILAALSAPSFAAEPQFTASLVPPPPRKASVFSWPSDPLLVQTRTAKEQPEQYVIVTGTLRRKHWSVLSGVTPVPVDKKTQRFSFLIVLSGQTTRATFRAVSPRGAIEEAEVAIQVERWPLVKPVSSPPIAKEPVLPKPEGDATAKPAHFFVSLGLSSISFQQRLVNPFSAQLLTAKGSYQARIGSSSWDWGVTSFISVVTLASNQPDLSARFFGASARVGYVLPFVKPPWQVIVMGGWYYTTMFVSPKRLGYGDIAGPMLFPVVKRELSPVDSLSAYFKISPVSDGIAVLDLSTREIAGGVAWTRALPGAHPWSITLDYADLSLALDHLNTWVKNRSLSVGGAWGF